MSIKTKEELKSYFETGDKPTQQHYEDLLDTIFARSESSIKKVDKVVIDLSTDINTIDETFKVIDVIPPPGEHKMIVLDTIKTFVKPVSDYTVEDLFGMSLVCDFTNHKTSTQGLATIVYGFDLNDNKQLVNKRSAIANTNYEIATNSSIVNSGVQIQYASNITENPPKAIDGKCKITVLLEYMIVDVS